ncbi:MAG: hypothetical protein ACOYL9_14090 [Ilumatobacteraceae bacterium]
MSLLSGGWLAHAEGSKSGPRVTADDTTVSPGERTLLTVDGFQSLFVSAVVCGNEARRGDADCAMPSARGIQTSIDGEPAMAKTYVSVVAPPMPCPCVIRVSAGDTRESAVVPIVVVGHPVADVVDPPSIGELMAVTIRTREAPAGAVDAIRSELGGPVTYRVTVRVTNTAPIPLKTVIVSGAGTRGSGTEILVDLPLEDPGRLEVGQTWEQTVEATIPGPLFDTVTWTATASGAGPAVTTETTTRNRPVLLIVVVGLLLLDLAYLLIRNLARRRAARDEVAGPDAGAPQVAPDDEPALV